jgi:broad specificity phosphatase PhoE
MLDLIFVRHGETIWSRTQQHTFRGRLDIPLNEMGVKQAIAVGRLLREKEIHHIYSSPLKRALDTAEEIAKLQKLKVQIHEGFIDLNFGDWQGKLHEDIKKQYPELYNQWLTKPHTITFPSGENLEIVRKRIESAINELIMKHESKSIVITTHGAVLRVILCYLHGVGNDHYWEYSMDNCAITIARFDGKKTEILVENENGHLMNLS